MSKVAVFQFHCCNRLFAWGRYSGNLHSSSGFYPQAWCRLCDPTKENHPRHGSYVSTCTFVGYTFDDRLDSPLSAIMPRILTRREVWRFIRNDKPARERIAKYPLRPEQYPEECD